MYEDVAKADACSRSSATSCDRAGSGSVHGFRSMKNCAVERMYVDIMTTRLERKLTLT